jgi:hypothetical protein
LTGELVATTGATYQGLEFPYFPPRFGAGTLFLFPDHLGFRPKAARDYQVPSAFRCAEIEAVEPTTNFGRPALVLRLAGGEEAVFIFALVGGSRDEWVKLLTERCTHGASKRSDAG